MKNSKRLIPKRKSEEWKDWEFNGLKYKVSNYGRIMHPELDTYRKQKNKWSLIKRVVTRETWNY